MQKIDKTQILSTHYEKWYKALPVPHPRFDNTTIRKNYYWDVVMSLYFCQKGLCAYTEKDIFADNSALFEASNWKSGKYQSSKPKHEGEVEHFDAALKNTEGWKWDNLFMVLGKVNREKAQKKVDKRLKPDDENYDPFKVLAYDVNKHIFIPNTTTFQNDNERKLLSDSILNLGINFVHGHRSRTLKRVLKQIELGIETWESVEFNEYPTAFEMLKIHFTNKSTN